MRALLPGEYSEPLVTDILSEMSFSISGSFLEGLLRCEPEDPLFASCFFRIDLDRRMVSGDVVVRSMESADADVLLFSFLSKQEKLF